MTGNMKISGLGWLCVENPSARGEHNRWIALVKLNQEQLRKIRNADLHDEDLYGHEMSASA